MKPTNRVVTVVAVLLSMFMAAMEATVVATAMPTIIKKLGGLEVYGWVGAAYMVASTVTMPLYGKLADLYGRRPIMLVGLAVFLAGSSACGFAESITQLIIFRAVQGIGAGGLQPIAMTIVGDLFKPAERARIQGVFGAVWGVAGMIGPLLGGLIVKALSWRWVFFINLPFGALATALFVYAFHEQVERKPHRLDFAGAALLAAAIVSLLFGVSGGTVWIMLPAAAVFLAGFGFVERRASEPVLPLELLARRLILVSSVAGALVGGVMIGSVTYLTFYAQEVMGAEPTEAGMAVTPMLVGWPIASAVAGRLLARVGYRPLVRTGFAIVLAAAVLVVPILRPDGSTVALALAMALMGVGLGTANTALVIAVQESVPWQQRGVATASTMFFRTIGGAVAIAGLGALMVEVLRGNVAPEVLAKLREHAHGVELDPETQAILKPHLATAIALIFRVVAGLSVAAFVASLFFPNAVMQKSTGPAEPIVGEE